jgi:ligand-binding sensor domain-containing protein
MHLHAVTTDARGRVWVGSLHGLYRFDPRTHAFHRESVATGALPVDWVTAIEPWGDGVVVGTYHGGLSWSDAAGERFDIERESRAAHALPAGWVNPHAMQWLSGTLFIGTLERGLVVGDKGRWSHLGVADGLPSADVTDFAAAGARTAWIATRGGLARVTW